VRASAPVAPARRQAPRLDGAVQRAASSAVVRKVQSPASAKGFALALTDGGKDEHDHDFERY
jgi:hypothetical protein